MEMGTWEGKKAIRLRQEEMHCMWVSLPVNFETSAKTLSLYYRYVLSSKDTTLNLTPVRHLTIHLSLLDSFTYTVNSHLNSPDYLNINPLATCSLLRNVDFSQNFSTQLRGVISVLGQREKGVSLKRLLSLCHYLKRTYEAEKGSFDLADSQICTELMRITEILASQMTEEIRPIVRKVVLWMGRCCVPYKEIMKSITNDRLIKRKKVSFGCECERLKELLEELFNPASMNDMGMVKVIVLNSIRRSLQSLCGKSTRPELLLMYDVWISVLQRSYIESQFLSSDPANIPNLLHQVSILAEYCQLNAVCTDICALVQGIEQLPSPIHTRDALIQMLESATWWLFRYIEATKVLGSSDFLNLKQVLIDIAAESADLLFATLSRAFYAVSTSIRPSFSLGIYPGQVTGKVISLADIEEITSDSSAVIALVRNLNPGVCEVKKQVKGIILLGNCELSSHLVAHCLDQKVVLGVMTQDRGEGLENKVEVRVTRDKVTFF